MSLEELHEHILTNALGLDTLKIVSKSIADRGFIHEFAKNNDPIIKSNIRKLCMAIANPDKRVSENLNQIIKLDDIFIPLDCQASELRIYSRDQQMCTSKLLYKKLIRKIRGPVLISFNELKKISTGECLSMLMDIESILGNLDNKVNLF